MASGAVGFVLGLIGAWGFGLVMSEIVPNANIWVGAAMMIFSVSGMAVLSWRSWKSERDKRTAERRRYTKQSLHLLDIQLGQASSPDERGKVLFDFMEREGMELGTNVRVVASGPESKEPRDD